MNESELCAEATRLQWRLALRLDPLSSPVRKSRLFAQRGQSGEAGLPRATHPH